MIPPLVLNEIREIKENMRVIEEVKQDIKQIRVELRNYKEEVRKLKEENNELKRECQMVTEENREIKQELQNVKRGMENFEKPRKENNIIATGLEMDTRGVHKLNDKIRNLFKEYLQVAIQPKKVSKLGERTCLVELKNEQEKQDIMRNKHDLIRLDKGRTGNERSN